MPFELYQRCVRTAYVYLVNFVSHIYSYELAYFNRADGPYAVKYAVTR